jgi:hypothetical protein
MLRVTGFLMAAAIIGWLGMPLRSADILSQTNDVQPLLVGDLEPKLDGKEVTVKFTITGLDGIAQLTKEGQAPSFAIETDSAKQKNMLSVWIEGELANVLDRLQMCAFQDNQLKAGTVICAMGKLTVHKTIPNQYFLNVNKWQGFRILPAKEDK